MMSIPLPISQFNIFNILKAYNCDKAIQLDGGGSCNFVAEGKKIVQGDGRKLNTVLTVKQRGSEIMANYVNITLDTTQPSNPSLLVNNNDVYTTNQLVNLTIGTGDGITTGYQMKIWGSVDTAYDTNIKTTEGTSTWITYATSKQIKLSTGDGSKTVYMKLRDDVWNESAQVSDSITLNTVVPVVTIGGQNVTKISKVTGKNELTFSFTSIVS